MDEALLHMISHSKMTLSAVSETVPSLTKIVKCDEESGIAIYLVNGV